MDDFPTLSTDRPILRQFQATEARLFDGYPEQKRSPPARFSPHPFEAGTAETRIAARQADYAAGRTITFVIVLVDSGQLIGSIGMEIVPAHEHARLSYWLGIEYWNRGYCTEAVIALLDYGFIRRNLHRI